MKSPTFCILSGDQCKQSNYACCYTKVANGPQREGGGRRERERQERHRERERDRDRQTDKQRESESMSAFCCFGIVDNNREIGQIFSPLCSRIEQRNWPSFCLIISTDRTEILPTFSLIKSIDRNEKLRPTFWLIKTVDKSAKLSTLGAINRWMFS